MTEDIALKIGANIANARRSLNLSQKDIALELKLEQSTISRIESGLRSSDKSLIYLQLLKNKGININDIFLSVS